MNLAYLLPRLARRFLPEKLVRVLLLRGLVIQPGIETSNPAGAVQRYADVLASKGASFNEKRVLVFGYGGRYDIGLELLRAGAAHVVLCDKFAPPDEEHNRRHFGAEDRYFTATSQGLRPRPEWMTLLQDDILDAAVRHAAGAVDVVLSSSVYEHVDQVEAVTRALASLTRPGGIHIHYVDLRDHFFKYPFEMLRFSARTWYGWLNPSSNHNRYRLWDYRRAFDESFAEVEIEVLGRDEAAFRKLLPRIRPEFVSGRIEDDAVTLICVVARKPHKPAR